MRKKRPFETQLTRLSLISSVPLLLLLWVMIYAEVSIWLILLTLLLASLLIAFVNYSIHQKLLYQFRSMNNLLRALAQGDYSLRAQSAENDGELGELVASINSLAARLSRQRRQSVESQLLVNTILEHIDVAILALTEETKISFFNQAAERLLVLDKRRSTAELLEQLAVVQSLHAGHHQVLELSLGYHQGRFNVHVEEFRESGLQHKLLFITDVRTLLRSEERNAWQRLVKVISHEINNSLSPIASISQTLNRLVRRQQPDGAHHKEITEGLTIIEERANGLGVFVDSYKQLTNLPQPDKRKVSVVGLFEKIRLLFKEQPVIVESEEDVELFVDPVQFEQVIINLFKNAFESMSRKVGQGGCVTVHWQVQDLFFKLHIKDQGDGIKNPENLFVPFYSTKKGGSGIGLVLCRQIVEAHNGRLTITNRTESPGCCVSLEIPYEQRQDQPSRVAGATSDARSSSARAGDSNG